MENWMGQVSEGSGQWARLYDKRVSKEDYKNICDNISGFFKILREWDKKEKESRK
jgi:hypothetical protein